MVPPAGFVQYSPEPASLPSDAQHPDSQARDSTDVEGWLSALDAEALKATSRRSGILWAIGVFQPPNE
jgi:hypothetical protein